MSYVDAAAASAQFQSLSSTFSTLGQDLAQSSPSGFQGVLAQMQTALAALGSGGTTSSSSGTTAASSDASMSTSTSSLLSAASTGSTTGGGSATGSTVVADASQYLGVPYVWGGTTPAGFDCSGLVQYVYRQVGVSLPRTSQEQVNVGTPVASVADAQPGDLVFFAGSDGTATSPGHVGIYIGNGEMIDAPHTGTNVQIQAVGNPTAIRRILPTATSMSMSMSTSTAATGSTLPANLGVPASLAPLFESAGQAEGVSPALLAAVAKQESGFQTSAVSGAGAEGLMQLMPSTAAGLGVNPFDPTQAIDGAAVLLHGYLNEFGGSVPLALAAYNAGPGAVQAAGGVPDITQTQNYVASITSMLDEGQT